MRSMVPTVIGSFKKRALIQPKRAAVAARTLITSRVFMNRGSRARFNLDRIRKGKLHVGISLRSGTGQAGLQVLGNDLRRYSSRAASLAK